MNLDFGASAIVKLGSLDLSGEVVRMHLKDAYYLDPETGEPIPWPECDPDG